MNSAINLSYISDAGPIDYRQALEELCQEQGLDYALFAARIPNSGQIYFYSSYPVEWTQFYVKNNLMAIDPVASVAPGSILPFDWMRLRDQENFKILAGHREALGIPNNGLTVPTHSPQGAVSILSVCKDATDSEWTRHITPRVGTLMLAAAKLHDDIIKRLDTGADMGGRGIDITPPRLDARQTEILQLLADGQDMEAVARATGLSRRTVKLQIDQICALLDSINDSHAVARAISLGLIEGPDKSDEVPATGT